MNLWGPKFLSETKRERERERERKKREAEAGLGPIWFLDSEPLE
jgi:hypothetical protein